MKDLVQQFHRVAFALWHGASQSRNQARVDAGEITQQEAEAMDQLENEERRADMHVIQLDAYMN